ncbi:uncharacterized protein KY384_003912 [Bacidia gigantensis]|uniref:uncharacterized protein n=1 Tax=Bacidia gigantensis TaxID=2732470 RepID=UPI001D04B7CC|nr:uncharacterized protein KY384_003912 [Bacidia gigantensis]KAG8532271.1 hypothetical protein KY384_003912 [Bacidia gigantensis]
MVVKSPHPDIGIPETNILSFLFGDGLNLPKKELWIDGHDDRKYLSHNSALSWIKRLALGLDRRDVRSGDVVMVVSPNHIFVPVAYLGTVCGGRIFSGANPAFTDDEVCYQMRDTSTRLVLVHPALLSTARKAAVKANIPDSALFLFSDSERASIDGIHDWRSLLAPEKEASLYTWPIYDGPASKSTIAAINYSSGTTGLPKGVMITHYNLIANVSQGVYLREDENGVERWIGVLPLYHAYGQMVLIMSAIKWKAQVYMQQKFDFEDYLGLVQEKRITRLHLAPPLVVLLEKHPSVSKYDLSSVERLGCGAAPLSESTETVVSKKFGTPIGQGWGMTEVTCTGTTCPAGFDDYKGSVGQLVPRSEAKLLDESGKEVQPGEKGELFYRGPNVSPGYWKNEKATGETMLEGGWLKTGDVAIVDEKGWFWIVDRLKACVAYGFQVAPAELEAILLTHPSIADAAVVGLSADFSGQEKVRAYVTIKPQAKGQIREGDIVSWTDSKVAAYKRLTGGVVFVVEVPKSASGKILRKVLREWAKRDASAEGTKARL